jgi:hypothetical protein
MAKLIREYELTPIDGSKSFYKKAIVRCYDDGVDVLGSYVTDVMSRDADGTLHRHWAGWSATTGRHVAAFCGINKKAWDKMPVEPLGKDHHWLSDALGRTNWVLD